MDPLSLVDLGLVVWKGYRPRVRLVLAGGHASAWISPFWRGPAPGAQRYQAEQSRINSAVHENDRPCFDFRLSQECQDAIAGLFPNHEDEADRIFQLSEGIQVLQRQHNDLVQEANRALYRLQQNWHALSEAYATFFNDL